MSIWTYKCLFYLVDFFPILSLFMLLLISFQLQLLETFSSWLLCPFNIPHFSFFFFLTLLMIIARYSGIFFKYITWSFDMNIYWGVVIKINIIKNLSPHIVNILLSWVMSYFPELHLIPSSPCVYPAPGLESTTSPSSPGSFNYRTIFGNRDLASRYVCS